MKNNNNRKLILKLNELKNDECILRRSLTAQKYEYLKSEGCEFKKEESFKFFENKSIFQYY